MPVYLIYKIYRWNIQQTPYLWMSLYISVHWYQYIYIIELLWPTASFTPAEFYYCCKLTWDPVIFQDNHIYHMLSTLLLHMQFDLIWSPAVAGLFNTIWFIFTNGFLPFSPGYQFRHRCRHYRFYLSCIKLNLLFFYSVYRRNILEEL